MENKPELENVLIPRFHEKFGGHIFHRVTVGTHRVRNLWGSNGRHREIDAVRLKIGDREESCQLSYSSTKQVFFEHIKQRRVAPWLLEAKTELNRGLIGQIIVGAHLFAAEFDQVIPKRLIAVIPKGEREAAIEQFCRERKVRINKDQEREIEVLRVVGTINLWPPDNEKRKLEMLDAYNRRRDITGKIYRNVPIGGSDQDGLYQGESKLAHIDAIRLAHTSNKKLKHEAICSFKGNEREFFKRAQNSEVVELIEIPRTHNRKIPRLLNRGVVGRLLLARYMLTKEHKTITVTNLAALCLSFNDPIAWVCNEKEDIATEYPNSRYVQRPVVLGQ
jgi:hypothetical protein